MREQTVKEGNGGQRIKAPTQEAGGGNFRDESKDTSSNSCKTDLGRVNIKSVKLKTLVRTSKEKNQTNDLTGDSYYKDGRKPVGRQTQMQW